MEYLKILSDFRKRPHTLQPAVENPNVLLYLLQVSMSSKTKHKRCRYAHSHLCPSPVHIAAHPSLEENFFFLKRENGEYELCMFGKGLDVKNIDCLQI